MYPENGGNPSLGLQPDSTAAPFVTDPTITFTPTDPAPTFTPTLEPTPTLLPWVQERLDQMTLEEKAGQLVLMGVDGSAMTTGICQQILSIRPAGIVLRGGNVSSPSQLRDFIVGLQSCAQNSSLFPLLIALDHEGQYVNRFESGVTWIPMAMAQAVAGDGEIPCQVAYLSGRELRYAGVNMVLGPSADVLLNLDNSVISTRSFGGDPAAVSEHVSQAVLGYLDAGLITVLKHFPRHGGVTEDSHIKLPVDGANRETLSESYLLPFAAGLEAGAPVVMTSHVAFPEIDSDQNPATASEPILTILKDEIDFDGVIVTDSIGMGAIKTTIGSITRATMLSINAGSDLILVTSPVQAVQVHDKIIRAVQEGQISQERLDDAVARVLTLKANFGLISHPVPQASAPDWTANANLVYTMAQRMVSVIKDEADLIPIPKQMKNILLVGPPDGWGLYSVLETAIRNQGHSLVRIQYPGPWNGVIPDGGLKNNILAQAGGYDLVIVLTWESHLNFINYGDRWQIDLVQGLLDSGIPLIVVGLKSPTDLVDFPSIPTYLATFGTTTGQNRGLTDILVGETVPTGENPLPQLP